MKWFPLLSVLCFTSQPVKSNPAQSAMDAAYAELKAEKWHTAEAHFTRAIKLTPASPAAYHGRGFARMEAGKLKQALRDLDAAVASGVDGALADRANLLWQLRKYKEVIDDSTAVLEKDPGHLLCLCYRGAALVQTGDHARGIEDLNKAVEMEPLAVWQRSWRAIAVAESAGGGVAAWYRANGGDTGVLPHRYELAYALWLADDNAAAIDECRGALGEAARIEELPSESLPGEIQKRESLPPGGALEDREIAAEIYKTLALAHESGRQYSQTILAASSCLALTSDDWTRRMMLKTRGKYLLQFKHWEAAANDAEAALHLSRDDRESKFILCEANWELGRYEKALEVLKPMVKTSSPEGILRQWIAAQYFETGQQKLAIQWFRRAVAAYEFACAEDEEDAFSRNELCWLLSTCPAVEIRNSRRALQLAEEVIALSGRTGYSLDLYATALASAEKWTDAVRIQKEALALPTDPFFRKDCEQRLVSWESRRQWSDRPDSILEKSRLSTTTRKPAARR